MLDYVKFESGGFAFEHPSAWPRRPLAGFETVVYGPGMLCVYFSLRVFPDRLKVPSDALSPIHLLATVHPEAPLQITGDKSQLGEIVGLTLHDEFIREGDPFETRLVTVRCLNGEAIVRACLAVVSPATLLDAAGPVIRHIIESFTIDGRPWTATKSLPAVAVSQIEIPQDAIIETGLFVSGKLPDLTLPEPVESAPPSPSQGPNTFLPTMVLAESMLSDVAPSTLSEPIDAPSLSDSAPATPQREGMAASVDAASFTVATITGGGAGFRDGPSALASFQRPNGITADAQGNLYVADYGNHRIRRISPEGITTTLAGGMPGNRDEPGALAMFNGPRGIVHASGYLYVADLNNFLVRRISLNGTVKTFAGSGTQGGADGPGIQAQFEAPRAVAADSVGNLYVADGSRIRRVSGDGKVQTIAGGAQGYQDGPTETALFDTLGSITLDGAGNMYVADVGNNCVRKISRRGQVTTLTGKGPSPIIEPVAVAAALDGTLYVADAGDFSVKCMFADESVAVIAGNGRQGHRDGQGGSAEGCAEFWSPTGLALVKNTLYVTERDTHVVRAVRLPKPVDSLGGAEPVIDRAPRAPQGASPAQLHSSPGSMQVFPSPSPFVPTQSQSPQPVAPRVPISRKAEDYVVSTLAGSESGFRDGSGESVRFNSPMGLCVDPHGTVYVADHFNHCIRGVTSDGMVLTLAGSLESGLKDDAGTRACFKGPLGIAVGPEGNLYVSDHVNGCIRIVSVKGEVRTLAGSGVQAARDGQGRFAQFEGPKGIAVNAAGRVYVADGTTVRCVEPDGTVQTLAGAERGFRDGKGSEAAFGWPYAIALDVEGNCYVADAANHAVRRVAPDGTVTTVFGGPNEKSLNFPSGIAVDQTGVIFVADTNNHRIVRLDPGSDGVGVAATLICGSRQGTRNGRGADAEFSGPRGIGVGPSGDLYVADSGAHRIVKITGPTAPVSVRKPGPTGTPTRPAPVVSPAVAPQDVPVPIKQNSDEYQRTPSGKLPTWTTDPSPPAPEGKLVESQVQSWTSDSVPASMRDLSERLEQVEQTSPTGSPSATAPEAPPVQAVQVQAIPPVSSRADIPKAAPTPSQSFPAAGEGGTPARRQRTPVAMFGWGLELVGHTTVRTEPDGALYLNTIQDIASSAFFFQPWEVLSDQEIAVELRMQLIAYVGDRAHTGCAVWIENEKYADALLIQPEGISLLRAPDLFHPCNTTAEPHTYTIIMQGRNIMVLMDGRLCLNGTNRFWPRPGAKNQDPANVRKWVAFGDGSSDAGSESRWFYVRYSVRESKPEA